MHFAQRRKINQAWYESVWAVTRGKVPPAPLDRAKIRIERHAPRTLDFDGCVGSFKPIVDGLIHAGVLSGDSWRVTGPWEVDQRIVTERDKHVYVVVDGRASGE